MRTLYQSICLLAIIALVYMAVPVLSIGGATARAQTQATRGLRIDIPFAYAGPSAVRVVRLLDGSFRYLVNSRSETFIGMGYNPIYRYLTDAERAASYDRDFQLLCEAGVNHITGWDSDKGYEQDKFDELTLDHALQFGIGVVMPFYLPVDGDYEDEAYRQSLLDAAAAKIARYQDHPALRMWGLGNEVLVEMASKRDQAAFVRFYVQIADLFHRLDPNHPVIYREAEDTYFPLFETALRAGGIERPWLLYGTNAYTMRLQEVLDNWPKLDPDRPLFVSEFGSEPYGAGGRAEGYAAMWQMIRDRSRYVLGGAPYTWTTAGPEPTDLKWGLMDAAANPIDNTFSRLAAEWQQTPGRGTCP